MASKNSRAESASRPISAGSITRNVKKSSSEGLIVLSPEPGSVKFEADTTQRPSSGSGWSESRIGSAGRVERKLLMARKAELADDEPRRNSVGARISGGEHGTSGQGESCSGQRINEQLHLKLKISHHKQPSNLVSSGGVRIAINGKGITDKSDDNNDDDASSSDSDTDESESDEPLKTEQEKVQAPLELKGEFLQAVMDEEYDKAQELCQKILLLEPDNATCQEFHAVIVEKKKQDEEAEEEDSEESDDDDEEDDDDDEDEESGEDEDDEDTSEDEDESESDSDDDLPPGPLNLIMGGLPIKPSSGQKTD